MSLSLSVPMAELSLLCDQMPMGVILHQDEKITFVNPAMLSILGYAKPSELLGKSPSDLVHPDQHAVLAARLRTNQAGAISKPLEERLRRKDGSYADVEVSGLPVQCEGKAATMALFRDLSQNKAADQEARENGARFKAIFESDMAGQAIVDDRCRIISANDALAGMLGLAGAQLAGRPLADCAVDPGSFQASWALALDRGAHNQEEEFRHYDGSSFPVAWSSRANVLPGQNFVTITDRSRQVKMEENLRQAQKMEAIGQLAGGVAHDFNNLLMIVMSNCQLLMERLEGRPDAQAHLGEVLDTCETGATITRQLLTFSRQQAYAAEVMDLNAQVLRTRTLLRRLLTENIHLDLTLEAPEPWVLTDPSSVEQILLNLCVNARDAMPQGGKLGLRTHAVDLDAGWLAASLALAPGPYVVLSVRDSGSGMSEEVRARAFEPFFTTKAVGKGTGMGLATVFGIVKGAAGSIRVISAPGAGCLFEIYLPRQAKGPALRAAESAAPAAPAGLYGGEKVLLVEDEPALRRTLGEALRDRGYEVIEAQHGDEALALLREMEILPQVVISDMVMPGMTGLDFLAHLRKDFGIERSILMSGYTDPGLFTAAPELAKENVFQKPMRIEKLMGRLRELLDSPGGPASSGEKP